MKKINNKVLLNAGLELMRANGKQLTEKPSFGRSMLYDMPNGQSVRVRTCNDHILVVVAEQPDINARLNIQGTDWLLIVMPEIERTEGKVIAYLVPTEKAEAAVRESHGIWLSSDPNTRGSNTTWNLWFSESSSGMDSRQAKHGYAKKWIEYLLEGDITTGDIMKMQVDQDSESGSIQAEVASARKRIARVMSVPIGAVKISIEFPA